MAKPLRKRLLVVALAVFAAIGIATTAYAAIVDDQEWYHVYGGYTCTYGGVSYLQSEGGSSGFSATGIINSSCQNGYRNLYTEARTTTNAVLTKYSDWVLYDYGWQYNNRTDLCQIVGSHRMSKAGTDSSPWNYTAVAGCFPG